MARDPALVGTPGALTFCHGVHGGQGAETLAPPHPLLTLTVTGLSSDCTDPPVSPCNADRSLQTSEYTEGRELSEGGAVGTFQLTGPGVAATDPAVALRKAQAGSFESFMRGHCTRLVRALTAISFDREVAADAAQEAFVQLYLNWDKVDEFRDPVAWLYRVGINRCKDYRRFLSRTTKLVERVASQAKSEADDDKTAGWTCDLEFASIFRSLPIRQRTAATLYYLHDLSVEEIARVMDISEGAVNSHLHRAREALRGLVEAG